MLSRSAALAALAFGLAVAAPRTVAHADPATRAIAAIGATAPNFTLPTIGGRTVSLADYRGKTLVINVWATWCPPCRKETPELVASYARLHLKDVAFLGVDTTEDPSLVRAFAAAKEIPYDEAVDASHAFARAYDIQYFPTTFVIDPDGIVRERHTDVIGSAQMEAFVAAASHRRSAVIDSPFQRRIDAVLAPNRFVFEGDADDVRRTVEAADSALAKVEKLSDETNPATGDIIDFDRMQRETSALRKRAITALGRLAGDRTDRALMWRLRGDDALAQERWHDAASAYRAALRIDPHATQALAGLARAESAQQHDSAALDARRRLAALAPSPENAINLAVAYADRSAWPDAEQAAHMAIAAAQRGWSAKPHDAHALRLVAWTHLYAGRIEARAGERDRARADFAQTTRWTASLSHNDAHYAMYLEEAQEATVALGLAANGTTVVSLAPWTGPDLPGSVASTVKYRLVVAGSAGRNVALTASGLPKHWIASFCSDRLCSPFHDSVVVPPSGVKVVEFQVIPDAPSSQHPTVRIDAQDDGGRTSVAAVVRA